MSGNPFEGATRDPIALLEQLIGQVGGLKSQMEDVRQELKQELKQEISGLRQELKQEFKQEISGLRQELKQEIGGLKQEIGGLKQEIGGLKQELKTIDGRLSALEVGFRQFRNETGGHLERIEGIFSHVAKKWMEHDEEIARLRRRPG